MVSPTMAQEADATQNEAGSNLWLGFGSPLRRARPTDNDVKLNSELDKYIDSQGIIEGNTDLLRRIEVLRRLERLCMDWIMEVYRGFGEYSEAQIRSVGGKLFTFGSYRLGVHFVGGDIDTLLLAPRRIDRNRFFAEFPDVLRQQPDAVGVTPVPEAFAPIIKMTFSGIEIDLLFCQSNKESIEDSVDILNDDADLLAGLDAKDIRSLNGCRVNEYILSCVPDHQVFRSALRAIKLWARRRCIYSNVLGYLGGISWAILIAFTSQKYPLANAAMVVRKMFLIFTEWDWPQPVFIRDPRDLEVGPIEGIPGITVWDPRAYMKDRQDQMPIITPVFPSQNTTYNVSDSQHQIMAAELKRGLEIVEKIRDGHADWSKLFDPLKFFVLYKSYLLVIAESGSEETLKPFAGLVESRLRRLVELLEKNELVKVCHVHPKQFPLRKPTKPSIQWMVGLEFNRPAGSATMKASHIDLSNDVYLFLQELKSYISRTG